MNKLGALASGAGLLSGKQGPEGHVIVTLF